MVSTFKVQLNNSNMCYFISSKQCFVLSLMSNGKLANYRANAMSILELMKMRTSLLLGLQSRAIHHLYPRKILGKQSSGCGNMVITCLCVVHCKFPFFLLKSIRFLVVKLRRNWVSHLVLTDILSQV